MNLILGQSALGLFKFADELGHWEGELVLFDSQTALQNLLLRSDGQLLRLTLPIRQYVVCFLLKRLKRPEEAFNADEHLINEIHLVFSQLFLVNCHLEDHIVRSDELLLKHISLLKLFLLLKTLLFRLSLLWLMFGPDWNCFLMTLLFEESTFIAHFWALSQQTLHSVQTPRSLVNLCLLSLLILHIFGIPLIYGHNACAVLQHLLILVYSVLCRRRVSLVMALMRGWNLCCCLRVIVLGIQLGVTVSKFSVLVADALRVGGCCGSCIWVICLRAIIGSFVGPERHFFARCCALHSRVRLGGGDLL